MSSSHDLFVKGFLSNLTEAIDFFDSSLPKSTTNLLDLGKLEPTKETFIGRDHDTLTFGKKRTMQKELKF